MKILVYLGIIVFAIAGYSCGTKSNAENSRKIEKLQVNISAGKNINRDIAKIKDLYIGFNNIARIVITRDRIDPLEIGKINRIISKLKYYEIVYSQLFFQNEIERTAYMVLMSDPEAQKIISDYIFLTRQLQEVEGGQFINL